ncbi:hypothetical protein NC652_022342 [Populus alba x Populus x berolinensis]|nr:hypothetical protein NC652_022342 [Populus alba x Populus x berolinensis]
MAKSKRKPAAAIKRPQDPFTYLPSFPAVIPSSGTGTSTAKEADGSPVDNTNASLDGFIMEDCSDDEDLEEEQLDFSCFEEEYERSPPSSPTLVTLEPPASPKGATFTRSNAIKTSNPPSSSPVSGKWRDLFSSNQNTTSCPKLMHFSALNDIESCPLLAKDLDHSCDDWKLCAIGYVSGNFLVIMR